MSDITKLMKAAERVVEEQFDTADGVHVGPTTGSLEKLTTVISEINNTLEKRLNKALWAISGTDDLVPKVEKALRITIAMSYKSGLAFNRGILLDSGDNCVEAFIKELEKS